MKALSKIEKQLNKNPQEPVIALWNRMRKAVAECYRVDEFANIRSVAEIMRCALIQAKRGPEIIRQVVEIKLRAERRAGELLGKQLKNPGGRPEKNRSKGTTSFCAGQSGLVTHPPSLKDLGISKDQSSKWQRIASIPEGKFEQFLVNKEELSSARAVSLARNLERQKRREETIQPELNKEKKYRIIYADPPWPYRADFMDKYGHAGAHYNTMTIKELCDLPIKDITEDDAVLFLWVTSPKLEQAFEIIDAWGFEYKTSFMWYKMRHNFGYYNSVRHEFLLVAGRGKSTPDIKKLYNSVIIIKRSNVHSEKPDYFREIIDRLYTHGKRIELFARKRVEGWDVWGAEV